MGFQFDARAVPPSVAMQPLPEGWYKTIIRKTNVKQTNKGDGSFCEVQCDVIEGPMQGRTVYWNLNFWNPSQQAVDIAYRQLSAICHVVGQHQIATQDNAPDGYIPQLHNIPFYILVTVTQGEKGPINNVRGCKDIYGNDPGKQGAPHNSTDRSMTAPMVAQQPGAPQGYPPAPQQQPVGWSAPVGGSAPGGYAPQAAPQPQPGAPSAPNGPGAWQAPSAPQGSSGPAPAPQQWQTGPAPGPQQQQPQQGPQGPGPGGASWQQNAPPQGAPPQGVGGAPTWSSAGPTQAAPTQSAPQAWQQNPGGAPANAPWTGQR